MKEVRPVKISLVNRTKEEFLSDIHLCFPVLDEVLIEKFYEQVTPLYREIVLDTLTGELLMGLTYNSGWLVHNYYLRNVATPETLQDYPMDNNMEHHEDDDFVPVQKSFKVDEETLNRIIVKIGETGVDSLSSRELDFLNNTSKYFRKE